MARSLRLKIMDEEAYYHVMSRTVGEKYLLEDEDKETLQDIISYFSQQYFVKVIGFCIMSNHMHLLVKTQPEQLYTDRQVWERIEKFILKKRPSSLSREYLLDKYRKRFGDLSEYVRSIKQTFSRWYNKYHNRKGYLWGDRFKSVLLEPGSSLLTCLSYIDLNPIRAGIVTKPEDYRWSSICCRISSARYDFLSFDGIFDDGNRSFKEQLADYRYIVYKAGNIERVRKSDLEEGRSNDRRARISDKLYREELRRNFVISKPEILLKKVRYFSDGCVIGSKRFCKMIYKKYGERYILKKDRNVYKTGLVDGILSIRRLKC